MFTDAPLDPNTEISSRSPLLHVLGSQSDAGVLTTLESPVGAATVTSDGWALVDPSDAFSLASGTVVLDIKTSEVTSSQGIYSRDASGKNGGGHQGITIEDGMLNVRMQDTSDSYWISTPIAADTAYQIALTWGANGMQLWLNGDLVGSNAYTGGTEGNNEPIALGASLGRSGAGSANGARDFFMGEIREVAVFDTAMSGAELEVFYAGSSLVEESVQDDPVADPVPGDEDGSAALRIQAEDMTVLDGYVEQSADTADGGSLMRIANRENAGTLETVLPVDAGIYTLQLTVYDEADGDGSVTLSVNGQSFTTALDLNAGGFGTDAGSLRVLTFENVTLAGDDVLTLSGARQSGEFARIDFLDVLPAAPVATNTAPVAADDAAATDYETTVTIDVLANDSDADYDALTVTTASAANGSIGINADGTLSYTPNAGFSGTDTISYAIDDGAGGSDSAQVVVTVADAPVDTGGGGDTGGDALPGQYLMAEIYTTGSGAGSASEARAVTNDPSALLGSFQATRIEYGDGGYVPGQPGVISYTRLKDFIGHDDADTVPDIATDKLAIRFTGFIEIPEGTHEISVRSDDGFVLDIGGTFYSSYEEARSFQRTRVEDTFEGGLYAIDLTYHENLLRQGLHMEIDGAIVTADALYSSTEAYEDAHGVTLAQVPGADGRVLFVEGADTPENTAPMAMDDAAQTVKAGGMLMGIDVLANDSDADGDPLSITSITAQNGMAMVMADGTVQYTPDAGFTGADRVTYEISDGQGGTATAGFDVTVEPVDTGANSAPMVMATVQMATKGGTPFILQKSTSDHMLGGGDMGGDPMAGHTVGSHDMGAPVADGYDMEDLGAATQDMASDDTGSHAHHAVGITLSEAGLLDGVMDADGDHLMIAGIEGAANGALFEMADGNWYYQPNELFDGIETLSVLVTDGKSPPVTATVEIEVSPPLNTLTHQAPGDTRLEEHLQFLDILKPQEATHIAIKSGDWSDPSTWLDGAVPDADAQVFIPAGFDVTYDVAPGDAPDLMWLRINGTLDWARDIDTKMVVDTIIAAPGSTVHMGTEDAPITADAEVIFRTDTGSILDRTDGHPIFDDPGQFSKGLVTHGEVRIYGTEKTEFIALDDAQAGDSTLTLRGSVDGWEIGDKLVLAGTQFDKYGDNAENTRFHDEVLEISGLSTNAEGDTVVSFINRTNDAADGLTTLLWDHERPAGHEDFTDIHVGNLTRNITFSSADGVDTATELRAHTMFMHNANVEAHDAAFYGLGRTDKDEFITDSNAKGRYSVHWHKTGDDDPMSKAAEGEGLVVWGSPGWGIVHHDSHLNLTNNLVFDVLGAGIVSEDGVEIGTWKDNFVVKTFGHTEEGIFDIDGNNSQRPKDFDFGFNGEAYWMQGGQLIRMEGNIAASSVIGVNHFRRSDRDQAAPEDARDVAISKMGHVAKGGELMVDRDGNVLYGLDGQPLVDEFGNPLVAEAGDWIPSPTGSQLLAAGYSPDDEFDNMISDLGANIDSQFYNVGTGIATWHSKRSNTGDIFFLGAGNDANHRNPDVFENVEIWNAFNQGIFFRYGSIHEIDGAFIHAAEGTRATGDKNGTKTKDISVGSAVGTNGQGTNTTILNAEIHNFEWGIMMGEPGISNSGFLDSENVNENNERPTIIDNVEFNNVDQIFYKTTLDTGIINHMSLPNFSEITNITVNGQAASFGGAEAAFAHAQVTDDGGLVLDANASHDWDQNRDGHRIGGDGLAAYGWDFNNDGVIDDWGRWTEAEFDAPGTYTVGLTVVDADGAITTSTQEVQVGAQAERSENMVVNGTFDAQTYEYGGIHLGSPFMNVGWIFNGGDSHSFGGGQTFSNDDRYWTIDETEGNGGVGFAQSVRGRPESWDALLQWFRDGSVHDGELEFSFDIRGVSGSGDFNVQIIGFSGEADVETDKVAEYEGTKLATEYAVLVDDTFNVSGTNWQNIGYSFDVGDGYDYYAVRLEQDSLVKIDNVFMGEAGQVIATDDEARVSGTGPAIIDVLNNDHDWTGTGKPTVISATSADGTVGINADGTLSFTPGTGFGGQARIDYTVQADDGDTATATAMVNYDPVSSDWLAVELLFEETEGGRAEGTSPYDFKPGLTTRLPVEIDGHIYGDARFDADGGVQGGGVVMQGDGEVTATLPFGTRADSDDRSLSMWFKSDDLSFNQVVLDSTDGKNLPVDRVSAYIEDGTLNIGAGHRSYVWGQAEVTEGAWHHIALVQEGGNTMSVFFDGTEIASGSGDVDGLSSIGWMLGNKDGRMETNGGLDNEIGLIGAVDEFRVYDRALSDAEISTLADEFWFV